MVFDIPTSKGNYQQRYQQLRTVTSLTLSGYRPLSHVILEQSLGGKDHKYIQIAAYQLCEGTDHLEKIFQDIMDQGGEGIILRDPEAPLQAGRSNTFLKHKVCISILKVSYESLSYNVEISRC